ncbi:MAG: PQQ-binding-like beta-propeller repeat protein [Planctomycetota bacterium]
MTRLCLLMVMILGWSSHFWGEDWPTFRGVNHGGVADEFSTPVEWNADDSVGERSNVRWAVDVPGLGHSSPVVVGQRVYLATAIAESGEAPLMVGRSGKPSAAEDNGVQSWVLLCYDKSNGEELWRRTARKGVPRATRHAKATHANTSVTVVGGRVVAFFGSEGLYCYDLNGEPLWSRDLGVVDISKYGIGWGYASSPAVYRDRIVLLCDDPKNPFLVALSLADGEEIWRVKREGMTERNWSTPFIHEADDRTQIVVNGWPWIVSYDLDSGDEFWRIRGGGDNPVPTPFEARGWFYITGAHGPEAPIFVVRPDAEGDVTPDESGTNESVVWSTRRGGCYMSTPVVYGDFLYLGNSNGVLRCRHATTGDLLYEERLGSRSGIIASLVAADGKVYAASENGTVYVVAGGAEYKLLAENKMGEPVFASPAVSEGVIYIRTTKRLVAVAENGPGK